MRAQGRFLAVIACFVVAAAGCTEPANKSSGPAGSSSVSVIPSASQAAPGKETGAVSGVVVDDEHLPIYGADVSILQVNLQTATDASGAFTFNDVSPGTYTLAAAKLGFASAGRKVDVLAGEVSNATIILKPISISQEPYVRAVHHTSYIQAGNAWFNFVTFLANDTGAHELFCQSCVWHFDFEKKPQGALSEAYWQCSPCYPPVVNDDVWFLVDQNTTTTAVNVINSYLSNREHFNWTEAMVNKVRHAAKDRAQFRVEAGGGSVGSAGASGVSYNQRVEFWQTFTYFSDVTENLTSLPPP